MTGTAEALPDLFRLETFGIRLGLENMRAACAALDRPERAVPVLHVAGTNGKGTTAAALAALAAAHGLRAGLHTSPHLVDLRERIRVDGRPIEPADLAAAWRRIAPVVTARRMTFFEATTLIAFDHFARSRLDLAIHEVGLGGRLDATNVVTPRLAIVTSIARDHESHLGRDLPSIAREKAGVFKPGVPALVGDPGPPSVRAALAGAARAAGAPLHVLPEEAAWTVREAGPDSTRFDYASADGAVVDDIHLPLPGPHFALDAALALRAWELAGPRPLDPGAARAALAACAPAGRADWREVEGVQILLDVAHNPAAFRRLVESVARLPGRSAFVLGFLADKAWPEMVDTARTVAAGAWVCDLATASPARRLDRAAAAAALAARTGVDWAGGVAEGLAAARAAVAAGVAARVVVAGSFHTVGEALLALGLAAPGVPAERSPAAVGAGVR